MVCQPLDECHIAGVWDPILQNCTNPFAPNGTTCNDHNLCTTQDSCFSGVCSGVAVTCSASDQCHEVGVCNPSTGSCTDPISVEGKPCDDGNLCILNETCHSGICQGTSVTCTAMDQCHEIGICNPLTGNCSQPNSLDGKTCNDSDLCTQTDTCQTGLCVGSNPVVCTPLDQCYTSGTCDSATGLCDNPMKANGSTCNDNNFCTQVDHCEDGVCLGVDPVICTALNDCHLVGVCDNTTGICTQPTKTDGSNCSDSNACTLGDTCFSGQCLSSSNVTCSASDQCHDIGTCNPMTGTCSNPNKLDGSSCAINNCTLSDNCQSGVCVVGTPVVCPLYASCNLNGICNAATGICMDPCPPNVTGAIINEQITNTFPFLIQIATFTTKNATLDNPALGYVPYQGNYTFLATLPWINSTMVL